MYDVAVIGSGVGGYPAAVLLARRGLSVALMESSRIGGTCVNHGCVPAKTLLHHAHIMLQALSHGYSIATPPLSKLLEEARRVASEASQGVKLLLEASGVSIYECHARIKRGDGSCFLIECGGERIEARNLILAPGSKPSTPKGVRLGDRVVVVDDFWYTSIEASRVAVIGGGPAGVEVAEALACSGVSVDLYEALDTLLPGLGGLGKTVQHILKGLGVNIYTSTPVEQAYTSNGGAVVCSRGVCRSYDLVVVSTGRRPRTSDLGVEAVGVEVDERGFIRLIEGQRTSNPHVYAAGDATGEPMLAHKAIAESIAAARMILGEPFYKPRVIPVVIYTSPQLAYVEDPELRGVDTTSYTLYWSYSLEAKLDSLTPRTCYVKLHYTRDGRIARAELALPEAASAAGLLAYIMEHRIPLSKAVEMIPPHPSSLEAVYEAMMEAIGRGYTRAR